MEISGKILKVMPLESGEGKNGTWKKQLLVIEIENGKYSKKVATTLWNDLTDNTFQEGAEISIEFDVESREYNGKWYTDVKAWKINKNSSVQVAKQEVKEDTSSYQANVESASASISNENEIEDNLPF
jgi:hypothetical protein